MILKEFFSKPIDIKNSQKDKKDKSSNTLDDVFWYILDNDKIHKDYFFPVAEQIKDSPSCSPEQIVELYMPMVKKGCKEFYVEKKLQGNLKKIFPKEFREELCSKLHDHYFDDVKNNKYNLGS